MKIEFSIEKPKKFPSLSLPKISLWRNRFNLNVCLVHRQSHGGQPYAKLEAVPREGCMYAQSSENINVLFFI